MRVRTCVERVFLVVDKVEGEAKDDLVVVFGEVLVQPLEAYEPRQELRAGSDGDN
jgi:hypothetical protein